MQLLDSNGDGAIDYEEFTFARKMLSQSGQDTVATAVHATHNTRAGSGRGAGFVCKYLGPPPRAPPHPASLSLPARHLLLTRSPTLCSPPTTPKQSWVCERILSLCTSPRLSSPFLAIRSASSLVGLGGDRPWDPNPTRSQPGTAKTTDNPVAPGRLPLAPARVTRLLHDRDPPAPPAPLQTTSSPSPVWWLGGRRGSLRGHSGGPPARRTMTSTSFLLPPSLSHPSRTLVRDLTVRRSISRDARCASAAICQKLGASGTPRSGLTPTTTSTARTAARARSASPCWRRPGLQRPAPAAAPPSRSSPGARPRYARASSAAPSIRSATRRYGNFGIILFLDRSSRISQLYVIPRAPCDVLCLVPILIGC